MSAGDQPGIARLQVHPVLGFDELDRIDAAGLDGLLHAFVNHHRTDMMGMHTSRSSIGGPE